MILSNFFYLGNVALMVTLLAGLGIKDSDGISMFPMAPILILWVNLLTRHACIQIHFNLFLIIFVVHLPLLD